MAGALSRVPSAVLFWKASPTTTPSYYPRYVLWNWAGGGGGKLEPRLLGPTEPDSRRVMGAPGP